MGRFLYGESMFRIYFFCAVAACGVGLYFYGRAAGVSRCRMDIGAATMRAHVQIIKQVEKVNEDAMHTGVGDIRRILREKYTIAE